MSIYIPLMKYQNERYTHEFSFVREPRLMYPL